jgi:tetratricopeptide (TPR) repeat protein
MESKPLLIQPPISVEKILQALKENQGSFEEAIWHFQFLHFSKAHVDADDIMHEETITSDALPAARAYQSILWYYLNREKKRINPTEDFSGREKSLDDTLARVMGEGKLSPLTIMMLMDYRGLLNRNLGRKKESMALFRKAYELSGRLMPNDQMPQTIVQNHLVTEFQGYITYNLASNDAFELPTNERKTLLEESVKRMRQALASAPDIYSSPQHVLVQLEKRERYLRGKFSQGLTSLC